MKIKNSFFSAILSAIIMTSCSLDLKNLVGTSEESGSTADASGSTIDVVAMPIFNPGPGVYIATQNVTVSSSTPDTSIYYTTNGSDPNCSGSGALLYSGSILIDSSLTLKAIACLPGLTDSVIAAGDYSITGTVAAPNFSVAAGSYNSPQVVSITSATPGAAIYYTTNGANPTCTGSGTLYAGAINVISTVTISAIACLQDWASSLVSSVTYTVFMGQVQTPVFYPSGGTYSAPQNLTISTLTDGAQIYYTTNGLNPNCSGTGILYTGAIAVNSSVTIHAIACLSNWSDSMVGNSSYTITGTVSTPVFSLAQGTFNTPQSVSISTASAGANIYYTMNGLAPTCSGTGTLYSGSISINSSMDIKAIACYSNWGDSIVSSASYTLQVVSPIFNPGSATYIVAQNVIISSATPGASIYFTTDGTNPSCLGSGTLYTSAINVNVTKTIRAVGCLSGWADSMMTASLYTITGTVAAPEYNPAAGTYTTAQSITLSSPTSGAAIYYTTDGTFPLCNGTGTLYTGPITASSSVTIKSIACLTGWSDSSMVSGLYTITGTVSSPIFSLAAGTFNTAQSITISTPSSGASIYYTTNGTNPNCSGIGTIYSGVINISSTTTLKAIACLSNWADSMVTSGQYTLQVEPPSANPVAGTYNTAQNVTLASPTVGASIIYTVNGTNPTCTGNGTAYTGAIAINITVTLKTIACILGWTNSIITSDVYTLQPVTPTYSPVPGNYSSAQTITLSTTTTLASIFYTTDGSNPTCTSNAYIGPMAINVSTTLKAIACRTGWTPSALSTGNYNIAGTQWNSRISGTISNLRDVVQGVTYANLLTTTRTYVAVGDSGAMVTSTDGTTWTVQNSSITASLNGIAVKNGFYSVFPIPGSYQPGLFVAVGNFGTIITSPDGVTWTSRSSGTANSINDVVWTGSQFVAVGLSGTILTSPDGIAWTIRNSNTTGHLHAISWMNGTSFLASGSSGVILQSPDGVTWTIQNTLPSSIADITNDGSTNFFAVANGGTSPGIMYTANFGSTWTTVNTNVFSGIAWTTAQFAVVGSPGIFISSTGTSGWTNYSLTNNLLKITSNYDGTQLVAVGNGGAIYSSP